MAFIGPKTGIHWQNDDFFQLLRAEKSLIKSIKLCFLKYIHKKLTKKTLTSLALYDRMYIK